MEHQVLINQKDNQEVELVNFSWHESNQDGLRMVVQLTLAELASKGLVDKALNNKKKQAQQQFIRCLYVLLLTVLSEEGISPSIPFCFVLPCCEKKLYQ